MKLLDTAVTVLGAIATFACGYLTGTLCAEKGGNKESFAHISDTKGVVWTVQRSDIYRISPDFDKTNIFRVWLNGGITMQVDAYNRAIVDDFISKSL